MSTLHRTNQLNLAKTTLMLAQCMLLLHSDFNFVADRQSVASSLSKLRVALPASIISTAGGVILQFNGSLEFISIMRSYSFYVQIRSATQFGKAWYGQKDAQPVWYWLKHAIYCASSQYFISMPSPVQISKKILPFIKQMNTRQAQFSNSCDAKFSLYACSPYLVYDYTWKAMCMNTRGIVSDAVLA